MTDWGKLKHFRGSAKALPGWVKRLSSAKHAQVFDALERLEEALIGSEKWCPAAAPALTLIFERLPKMKVGTGACLALVADVVGASHFGALRPSHKRPPKKIVKVVRDHLDSLLALAQSDDADARAGFTLVAGVLPELRERTQETLVRLSGDVDPIVRMSALLALAAVGDDEAVEVVRNRGDDAVAGVKGAAALAETALVDDLAYREREDALQGWLAFRRPEWAPGEPDLYWYARGGGTDVLRPLRDIAARRGDEEELLPLMVANPGSAGPAISELVVEAGGFAEDFSSDYEGYVALPEELDERQRELAEALVDSELLPVAAFGLPACGAPRRRWWGREPPGPSDEPVEVKVGRKTYHGPLWRVWEDLIRDDLAAWGVLPEPLAEVCGGLDRWEILVDKGVRSYGGAGIDHDSVEPELELVKGDAGLFERAEKIAADLARRYRAARGYEWVCGQYVYESAPARAAALLLLPFVRAGRSWPAEWDIILDADESALTLAVAAALPAERRWALTLERVEQFANKSFNGCYASAAVALVGLDRDRKSADALREIAATLDDQRRAYLKDKLSALE